MRASAPSSPEGERRGVRKHDSGVTIASADAYDAICVQSGLKLQLLQRRTVAWVDTERVGGKGGNREQGVENGSVEEG